MLIQLFKSKIHRAIITEANLNYVGSITIDEDLMEAANLFEGERVQVVNNNNGERLRLMSSEESEERVLYALMVLLPVKCM